MRASLRVRRFGHETGDLKRQESMRGVGRVSSPRAGWWKVRPPHRVSDIMDQVRALAVVREAIGARDRQPITQVDGTTIVGLRTLSARLQRLVESGGGEPIVEFSPHVVEFMARYGMSNPTVRPTSASTTH